MYNETQSVLNKDVLAVLSDVAYCKVCKGIIINPVQCLKCDNCFCKQCSISWSKTSKQCPYGCETFKTKRSILLEKALNKLKFKCQNNCGEEISYKDMSDHYQTKCSKIDFKKQFYSICDMISNIKLRITQLKKERKELTQKLLNDEYDQYQLRDTDVIYVSKYHPHPLKQFSSTISGYRCDICRESIINNSAWFACRKCDYDYCSACRAEEEKEDQ